MENHKSVKERENKCVNIKQKSTRITITVTLKDLEILIASSFFQVFLRPVSFKSIVKQRICQCDSYTTV